MLPLRCPSQKTHLPLQMPWQMYSVCTTKPYHVPFVFIPPVDCFLSPDETLAMSYLYMNKYLRFHVSSSTPDPLDPYVSLPHRSPAIPLASKYRALISPKSPGTLFKPISIPYSCPNQPASHPLDPLPLHYFPSSQIHRIPPPPLLHPPSGSCPPPPLIIHRTTASCNPLPKIRNPPRHPRPSRSHPSPRPRIPTPPPLAIRISATVPRARHGRR